MSGGYSMASTRGHCCLLLCLCLIGVVSCVDDTSNLLNDSNLITASGCYENVDSGINITCPAANGVVLLKDMVYGKRNGTDNTCSLTNYHDCFQVFTDENVLSYLHQCSGQTACSPKVVWGQFKGLCASLVTSDFIFVKYFCLQDQLNFPFVVSSDCVQKEKIYMRYKGDASDTFKCLIESPSSTGLVVRALDVRLQETPTDENGKGNCSTDSNKQHSLRIDDKSTVKDFTCQDGRMQFSDIYTTSKSSILITLTIVAGQAKPSSAWLEITAGGATGQEIYMSCKSTHVLSDTAVCLPTTTSSTTETSTESETTTTMTDSTTDSTTETGTQSERTTGGGAGGQTTTNGSGQGASTAAQDSDGGVEEGAIAGGIVGFLVLLLLIIAICCACRKRRKAKSERKERPESANFAPAAKSMTIVPPQLLTTHDSSNGLTVYPSSTKTNSNTQFINEAYIPTDTEHVTSISDTTPAIISNIQETDINQHASAIKSSTDEVAPFDFLKGMDTTVDPVNVVGDNVPPALADLGPLEAHDDALFIADPSDDGDEPEIIDDDPYRRFGPKHHPEPAHQPVETIFATSPISRTSSSSPQSPPPVEFTDPVQNIEIPDPVDGLRDRFEPDIPTSVEFTDPVQNIEIPDPVDGLQDRFEPDIPTPGHYEPDDDVVYAQLRKTPKQFAETGEHSYGRIERPPSRIVDVDDFDKVDRRILRLSSARNEDVIPDGSTVVEVMKPPVSVPEPSAFVEMRKPVKPIEQPTSVVVKKPAPSYINPKAPKFKSTISITTKVKNTDTTVL